MEDQELPVLFSRQLNNYTFKIQATADALWINARWPNGGYVAFRAAYAPGGQLTVEQTTELENYLMRQ